MSTNESRLDWREGRRRRAWKLMQQSWKQQGTVDTAAPKARPARVTRRRYAALGMHVSRAAYYVHVLGYSDPCL
jgi:hypothetical protein